MALGSSAFSLELCFSSWRGAGTGGAIGTIDLAISSSFISWRLSLMFVLSEANFCLKSYPSQICNWISQLSQRSLSTLDACMHEPMIELTLKHVQNTRSERISWSNTIFLRISGCHGNSKYGNRETIHHRHHLGSYDFKHIACSVSSRPSSQDRPRRKYKTASRSSWPLVIQDKIVLLRKLKRFQKCKAHILWSEGPFGRDLGWYCAVFRGLALLIHWT